VRFADGLGETIAGERGPVPGFEACEARRLMATLPLVVVSVSDADCAEADQNQGRFTITRFGNIDQALKVNFTIGGNAQAGVDYTGLSGSATIPAGRRSVNLPIIPIDDLDVEGPETVRLILSANDTVYRLDQNTPSNRNQAISIVDDDTMSAISVRTPDNVAGELENNTGTFVIRRTGAIDLPLTVSFKISGSATPGVDYDDLGTSVTIPAGKRGVPLTVRVNDDTRFEGNETVRLIVLPSEDGRYVLSEDVNEKTARTVFITDRPLVSLTVTDPLATSFPDDTAEFTIFRTGPVNTALQVKYTLSGNAVQRVDFAKLPNLITIPAGKKFVTVMIRGLNAQLSETVKTLTMTLSPLGTYSINGLAPASVAGSVRIIDDSVPLG
jgi:hypothetical protein